MAIQENTINRQLEIWLHIGIWILFLFIHALLFSRFLPFEVSLLRSIGNVLPMALLFYFNLGFVNKYLERKHYVIYALMIVALLIAITVLRAQLNMLFPDIRGNIVVMKEWEGWSIGAAITNLIMLIISVFYQILYNRYHNEQRNLAIINEQNEAQLQFLRAQINPHFLFNTLNNIYALAVIKSDKTADMVLKLSNLLRYVIYDGKAEQVALQREVEHIQHFIELFQMRSEKTLNIDFQVISSTSDTRIEPMILIPIVENCFKHCDFDTNELAFINISLAVREETLHFQTINSKDEKDVQKDKVGGVGLENIRKRLELKYKAQYQLEIVNTEKRFEVDLRLKIL